MSDVAKPKKTAAKKSEKRKDPNAPKKPLTAYILFSNAMRDKVKKENPDIKFGDVAKVISTMWKECSPSDQAKYQKAAADDKKRYEKEMADYEARGGAGSSEQPAKKKKAAAKKAEPEEAADEDDEEEASEDE